MEDIFVVVPTLNPNIEIFKKFLDNLLESTKNVLCQLSSADAGTGSVCGCLVRAYPPGKQSAVPPL